MKLTTTFWSEVIHTFSALYFINNKTNEIIFKTDLNNKIETFSNKAAEKMLVKR